MEGSYDIKGICMEYLKSNEREYNKIKKKKKVTLIHLPFSNTEFYDALIEFLKLEKINYEEILVKRDENSHEKIYEFYYKPRYEDLKNAIKILDEAYNKFEKDKILKHFKNSEKIPSVITNSVKKALKTNKQIINFWIDRKINDLTDENIKRYKIEWYGIEYFPLIENIDNFMENFKKFQDYIKNFNISTDEYGFIGIEETISKIDKQKFDEIFSHFNENYQKFNSVNISKFLLLIYLMNSENEEIFFKISEFINFIKASGEHFQRYISLWIYERIDIDTDMFLREVKEFDDSRLNELKDLLSYISEEKVNEIKEEIIKENIYINREAVKDFLKIYWDIYDSDENYILSSKYLADLTYEGPVILYGNGKTSLIYSILKNIDSEVIFMKNFDILIKNLSISDKLQNLIFFYDYDVEGNADYDITGILKNISEIKNTGKRFFRIIFSIRDITKIDMEGAKDKVQYILNIKEQKYENGIKINFAKIDWEIFGKSFVLNYLPEELKNINDDVLNRIIKISNESPEIMKYLSFIISEIKSENDIIEFLNSCKGQNYDCIYNFMKKMSQNPAPFILFLLYSMKNTVPIKYSHIFGMNEKLRRLFYEYNGNILISKSMKSILLNLSSTDDEILKYVSTSIFDLIDLISNYKFKNRNENFIDRMNEIQEKAEKLILDETTHKFSLIYYLFKNLSNININESTDYLEFVINSLLNDENGYFIYYFINLLFRKYKFLYPVDLDFLNYVSENFNSKDSAFLYFYYHRESLTGKYIRKILESKLYFNEFERDIYIEYLIEKIPENIILRYEKSTNNEELLLKSLALIEKGSYDDASQILENILKRDIDNVDARIALSMSYYKKFHVDENQNREFLEMASNSLNELFRLNRKNRHSIILKSLILTEFYENFTVNNIKFMKEIIPDIDSIFVLYPNFSHGHYVKSKILYDISMEENDHDAETIYLNGSMDEINKAISVFPLYGEFIFQKFKIEKRLAQKGMNFEKNLKDAYENLNYFFDENNLNHIKEKHDLYLILYENGMKIGNENLEEELNKIEETLKNRNKIFYISGKLKRLYIEYKKFNKTDILNESESLISEGISSNIKEHEFLEYSIKVLYEIYKISNREKKKEIYEKIEELTSIYNINKVNKIIIFINTAIKIYENMVNSIEEIKGSVEKIKYGLEDKYYRIDAIKILSILYISLYRNSPGKEKIQYLDEAIKYAEIYLNEDNSNPYAYYNYINKLFDRFEYSKDIQILNQIENVLNQAIKNFSEDPYILSSMGLYYLYRYNSTRNREEKKKNITLAKEYFEKALSKNPGFEIALKNLQNINNMKIR
ncbi:MAG: hypothetical protein ACP5RZ_04225 [Thermoplasmata archaeon]